MNLIPKLEFLNWAESCELRADSNGTLVFENNLEPVKWLTPPHVCDLMGFISILMKQSSANGPFYLWLRNGQSWFTGTGYNEGPLAEQIRDRIIGILPIPKEFNGALKFEESEWGNIVLVVSTFLIYGWCFQDDLQLIGGDGSTAIVFNHHSVISVRCKTAELINSFTIAMQSKNYEPFVPPNHFKKERSK